MLDVECWMLDVGAPFCLLHFHFESYGHGAAFRRVLEGVVNQVDQGLLEGLAVGGRLRVNGWEDELEFDAAFGGVGLHQLDGLLREGEQVGWLEIVLLAALLDAREVQDVLDQGREAAAFLDDEAEVFVLFRGLGHFAPFEALGHQAH
jgi:hypothetical protein